MKALRILSWGVEPAPEEVPEPTPGEGEVLVRAEACGVGLTVLNCIPGDLGTSPGDLPRVPGHELVGRIVDVGPGVDRTRRGERVAAYFYLFCGRCRRCLGGWQNLCDALAGYVGVNQDGGYAELAVLPNATRSGSQAASTRSWRRSSRTRSRPPCTSLTWRGSGPASASR